MGKTLFSSLAALAVIVSGSLAVAGDGSPIGKQVDNFSARDFRGKSTSLADFSESKAVAVAFVGTECPLAKLYAPRLVELAAEFKARGVAFVAIDSNRQDSDTELAHFAK